MKVVVSGLAALAIAASVSSGAQAGPATDAFGKCLVQSSTGKDRIVFVQWFFAALSVNPDVQAFAGATKEQRVAVAKKAAAVFQRLILTDCHAEAVVAIRQDGAQAFAASFEAFGRSAATELMSDPTVEKEISAFTDYIDQAKVAALMEEAKK